MSRTASENRTTAGNVFVSNYPPYSFWNESHIGAYEERLRCAPERDAPVGIYIHLPFCRQRCDFCYYKVYTDKNAAEIRRYLDAVVQEARLYADRPYMQGREVSLVYFGGGTPSFLSASQLERLFKGLSEVFPFDRAKEVTFECEPGTLQADKILALRELGVTRLSLGVENFSADILERNNRAHRAKEIYTAFDKARETGFDQINIDLIAGMVGETDENWRRCIDETRRLRPDSVTIYQIEIPYNTNLYRRMKETGAEAAPVADWDTKRRWHAEAFRALEADGYTISSAYTARLGKAEFLYRDALFFGDDLLGLGVSSFSHLGGVHAQTEHEFGPYLTRVEKGELPILRAYEPDEEERLIREFVLQMKLGRVDTARLAARFGVDPIERFRDPLARHERDGFLIVRDGEVVLTREGLLRADGLLPEFFLERHKGARYA